MCGQSIRRDAAHECPPASRRTVGGAFLLPAVSQSAAPGSSGWTKSQGAASELLAALQLTFRGMENRGEYYQQRCIRLTATQRVARMRDPLARNDDSHN